MRRVRLTTLGLAPLASLLLATVSLAQATSPAASPAPAAATAPAAPPPGTRFTAEQVAAGHDQFHRSCAQCHGRNMVNSGTTVYDLRKFPLDQPERFFHSVTQGKGNMPSFKDNLTPEQVSLLWAYVGTRGGKEL